MHGKRIAPDNKLYRSTWQLYKQGATVTAICEILHIAPDDVRAFVGRHTGMFTIRMLRGCPPEVTLCLRCGIRAQRSTLDERGLCPECQFEKMTGLPATYWTVQGYEPQDDGERAIVEAARQAIIQDAVRLRRHGAREADLGV